MKKVFFGLLVVMTAVGVSTLTNAKGIRFAQTFYQTEEGKWVSDPGNSPTGFSCQSPVEEPCTLTFPEDLPSEITEFNQDDRASLEILYGTPTKGENRLYEPNP